ncbi:MAG: PaaI family thioesterase [Rubrivivax sp.]|nr:PaaI family thioesterase [Rubrivivax sp.]
MDLPTLTRILEPLFPGLMGVQLLELDPQRVRAQMRVRPELCTTGGLLHGGASMAFADTLGAVGTVLNLGPGQGTTTTSSATQFISGAGVGTVVQGDRRALHRGRTTMVWQTEITRADGRLCAVVTQTQLVMQARS